jgi:hypothetical protein
MKQYHIQVELAHSSMKSEAKHTHYEIFNSLLLLKKIAALIYFTVNSFFYFYVEFYKYSLCKYGSIYYLMHNFILLKDLLSYKN